MRSVDNQLVALPAAGPGGWNDMDELFMVGHGSEHAGTLKMNFVERQTSKMPARLDDPACPLTLGRGSVQLLDGVCGAALHRRRRREPRRRLAAGQGGAGALHQQGKPPRYR